MLSTLARRDRRLTPLEEYASRLGTVVRRHQAQVALVQARRQAEEASRAKSAFLANMSHELRTPLNAIIGFAELMAEGPGPGEPPDRSREYARDILASGRHLLGIVNDVLDLARVEAGRLELEEDAVDLSDLAASAVAMLAERARAGGVRIEEAVPRDLPPVRVDARRMRQVLINLLGNAVKFTPAGGRVAVSASVAGGALEIAVSDTGVGIPSDRIERVMQPFVQADGDLARRFEGAGLGLPLSRALVELHGGALELASAPGRGTTATVRLPPGRIGPHREPIQDGKVGHGRTSAGGR